MIEYDEFYPGQNKRLKHDLNKFYDEGRQKVVKVAYHSVFGHLLDDERPSLSDFINLVASAFGENNKIHGFRTNDLPFHTEIIFICGGTNKNYDINLIIKYRKIIKRHNLASV